jgi:hypothetical protein
MAFGNRSRRAFLVDVVHPGSRRRYLALRHGRYRPLFTSQQNPQTDPNEAAAGDPTYNLGADVLADQ